MKKTYLVIGLLTAGLLLLAASLILTAVAAADLDIIGGTGLPTYLHLFLRDRGGLYAGLALVGVGFCVGAAVVGITASKKKD